MIHGSCLGPLLFIIDLNYFEIYLDFSLASMHAEGAHVTLTFSNIYLIKNTTREKYLGMDASE